VKADKTTGPCTVDPAANCGPCEIRGQLHCDRGNKTRTKLFYSALLLLILTALSSLGVTAYFVPGAWWTIPVYLVYWVVYQLYVELVVHCPRCPYWDDSSQEIVCLANSGIPKPKWKWLKPHLRYDPRPYSRGEKALLQVFNNFSVGFPAVVTGVGAALYPHVAFAVSAVALGLSASFFLFVLKTKMCAGCAHLECPLNALPKDVGRIFAEKNASALNSRQSSNRSCKGCSP
jgi:hypothetical protein